VVEDRAPQRDRPVAVVDEVEQPRLLRPVDVRGGRDLPEAAVRAAARLVAVDAGARHRADPVLVLVAGDETDHGRMAQEQALDGLRRPGRLRAGARGRGLAQVHVLIGRRRVVAGRERAHRLVHRLERVVGEHERELARLVGRGELLVEPGELRLVEVAAVAAGVGHGVEHHEAHTRPRMERVVALVQLEVGLREPVTDRHARGDEVLLDVLALEQQMTARVLRDGPRQRRVGGGGDQGVAHAGRGGVGAGGQAGHLHAAGGDRVERRVPVLVALHEAVVVAEDAVPRHVLEAGGQERLVHALEQARVVAHLLERCASASFCSWRGE